MKTYIREIDNKWYAFGCIVERGQIYAIGADKPDYVRTGCYAHVANLCDAGIKYIVSSSPNRAAAYQKARRHGEYCGTI